MKRMALFALALSTAVGSAQAAAIGYAEGKAPVSVAAAAAILPIYIVPGVTGGGLGRTMATSFLCSNFGTTPVNLQFVIRNREGTILRVASVGPIGSRHTFTAITHSAIAFNHDVELTPDALIDQGSAVIGASAKTVYCSALIVDTGSLVPASAASLHMVRLNPAPGTVE